MSATEQQNVPWTPGFLSVPRGWENLVNAVSDRLQVDGVSLKTAIGVVSTLAQHLPTRVASDREAALQAEMKGLQAQFDNAVLEGYEAKRLLREAQEALAQKQTEIERVQRERGQAAAVAAQMAMKRRDEVDCDSYSRNIFIDIANILTEKIKPPGLAPESAQV